MCCLALSCFPRQRLNLILISLDTTRSDHLGCYGYSLSTSPTIDKLASEGTVFTRFWAQSAVTPSSHASIMTGLIPPHHGLRSLHGLTNNVLPDSGISTLAEVLRDKGYSTGAFVSAFTLHERWGLNQGFETYDQDFPRAGNPERLITNSGIVNTGTSQRRADETTGRVIEWLENASQSNKPFFAFVHFFDPHDPLLRPPENYYKPFIVNKQNRGEQLTGLYDSEILFCDDQIKRIYRFLAEKELADNTIVVITADHGEGLGEHNWWGHTILWDEQLRVPLIIHAPGLVKKLKIKSPAASIDITPTLLDLLRIKSSIAFDGISWAKSLKSGQEEETSSGRAIYAESANNLIAYSGRPEQNQRWQALVKFPYKYIRVVDLDNGATQEYLFNIELEPDEYESLIYDQPDNAQMMRRALDSLHIEPAPPPSDSSSLDRETLDNLRSIGYF